MLILRQFRSGAGDEERGLTELRKRAAVMIRSRRAEAVLVCQRVDIPQRLLWIQHHAGLSVTAVNAEESPSFASGFVEQDGAAVSAEFVDGAYPAGADHGSESEPEELTMSLVGVIYVVTCGHCGQTWQLTSIVDGQAMECIFCGRRGHLSLGAMPNDTAGGAPRVEAWLR